MQIISQPRVTLLARPHFINPDHFKFKASHESPAQDLSEFASRLCYMSFGEGTMDGHKTVQGRKTIEKYFQNIKDQGHGSVFEHANFSLLFEGVSRSLTHELVRHRAGFAYSQLSQRFVEPTDIAFVKPPALEHGSNAYHAWVKLCETAQATYKTIVDQMRGAESTIEHKKLRECARSVLPNCAETKIVVTANVRAWRHFLTMRGSLGADREIRTLALWVLITMKAEAPLLFSDFNRAISDDGVHYIATEYKHV